MMRPGRYIRSKPKSLSVSNSPASIVPKHSQFKIPLEKKNKYTINVRTIAKNELQKAINKTQPPQKLHPKFKINSIRIKTEDYVSLNQTSKRNIKTLEHSTHQRTKIQQLSDFQREEIKRYPMFFCGRRKINKIDDFTDSEGDAKVSIGDSIIYRYQIKNTLGRGAFGQVFKALDHKKKQLIALKIIRNHHKLSKQAKIQIKLLQTCQLHDPSDVKNIIRMKHAFFFRGHACIIFELLSVNLYQMMKMYNFVGLSLDIVRRISIQILHGLNFLQKHSIIHCDLKPQNILLRKENKTGIKIIDLGSGCLEEEQIYNYIQSRYYRSPQIILNIPYTSAIDMWSFGCVVVELFVGYPLFPGEDQIQQINLFMEMLGPPPEKILEQGVRSKLFFEDGEFKHKKKLKKRIRSRTLPSILKASNDEHLVDFVSKCLDWNFATRLTPKHALLHPFIVNSLPEEIRSEHTENILMN